MLPARDKQTSLEVVRLPTYNHAHYLAPCYAYLLLGRDPVVFILRRLCNMPHHRAAARGGAILAPRQPAY